jgi:hypothetical protein
MSRADESGDGHAHAGGVGHDVVVAVAIPVVDSLPQVADGGVGGDAARVVAALAAIAW